MKKTDILGTLLGITLLVLAGTAYFAFSQSQEVEKSNAQAVALTKEIQQQEQRVARMKEIAEQMAAKAVDAEAQEMITKEKLEQCMGK